MVFIRRATIEDIKQIALLQHAMMQEHGDAYDAEYYAPAENAEEDWLRWAKTKVEAREAVFFVAVNFIEEGEKIVGYVSGWIEERPPIYALRKIGYLSNMYVVPDMRGMKIGKKLNDVIVQWFREGGVSSVELNVDVRSEAVAVWEAMGYKEIGKRMRFSIQ